MELIRGYACRIGGRISTLSGLQERGRISTLICCKMASSTVWQDREIKFDAPVHLLQMRAGESVIDYLSQVEDTKGNNGHRGKLFVTNLRVIWTSADYQRVNLSIGYHTVTSVTTKRVNSKQRGTTEALYLMTKVDKTQFEFIFTNLVPDSPRLFSTVMSVYRAYETSKPYRELKLRSALLGESKELKLLPREQLYTKLNGVWNLCSDQGNLGTMYITNVRVVWHSNLNESFNISVPYLQMRLVKVRDSKFGVAMVMETSEHSGGFVLGFRVDPYEKLKDVVQEIHSLYQVYCASPVFGVEFQVEQQSSGDNEQSLPVPESVTDDIEVVETKDKMDTFAAYYADPHKSVDRDPVFSPELGLAIEKLPEGYSLQDLWDVT
ncbi:Bardet-Biedl syndrome 5 protein homolog isoform X1 [Halichondria panicea]|uniref:Bardet-Biedl syndrome 5 protein homolog isoform X1 n=2 Tax=Halichondria panicea TaxID=6063 RepID=UPI00312B62F2